MLQIIIVVSSSMPVPTISWSDSAVLSTDESRSCCMSAPCPWKPLTHESLVQAQSCSDTYEGIHASRGDTLVVGDVSWIKGATFVQTTPSWICGMGSAKKLSGRVSEVNEASDIGDDGNVSRQSVQHPSSSTMQRQQTLLAQLWQHCVKFEFVPQLEHEITFWIWHSNRES